MCLLILRHTLETTSISKLSQPRAFTCRWSGPKYLPSFVVPSLFSSLLKRYQTSSIHFRNSQIELSRVHLDSSTGPPLLPKLKFRNILHPPGQINRLSSTLQTLIALYSTNPRERLQHGAQRDLLPVGDNSRVP
jgi:hypothetical protein